MGILDGQGHAITNMYQDNYAGGLFLRTSGATIQDLALENLNIANAAAGFAGGLAWEANNTTLSNVSVSGSITISNIASV